MAAIKANGITLEYESFGRPNDPAILLVMGLGMQLLAWPEPFCQTLADGGFHVIRFDNRDVGLSSKFGHLGTPNLVWASLKNWLGLPIRNVGYRLDDMAADAVALLDGLAIQKAHLVGASMGGMIAQLVAAHYPARTLSLTSIMSSTGNPRLPGPSRHVVKALLRRPDNPRDVESVVDHYVEFFRLIGSPGFAIDETELRQRLEKSVRRSHYPPGSARQIMAIVASGDRTAALGRITAPALVIHGDKDPLIPLPAGKDTAAKIPGATLQIVPGMGHDLAAWPVLADAIGRHCKDCRCHSPSP